MRGARDERAKAEAFHVKRGSLSLPVPRLRPGLKPGGVSDARAGACCVGVKGPPTGTPGQEGVRVLGRSVGTRPRAGIAHGSAQERRRVVATAAVSEERGPINQAALPWALRATGYGPSPFVEGISSNRGAPAPVGARRRRLSPGKSGITSTPTASSASR